MDVLALLKEHLEKPPRIKDRAPPGFDKQLKATSESPTVDVWVTLLQEGFQAWYAYFVADAETRAVVDELPLLKLQHLAKELCHVVPHDEIKKLFLHLFAGADRGLTRCRMWFHDLANKQRSNDMHTGYLEARGGCMPAYLNHINRKRRRTVPTDSPEGSERTAPIGGAAASAPITPNLVQQLAFVNRIREEGAAAQGFSTAGHYVREEGATAGHRIREEDATTRGFLTTGHRVRKEDATAHGSSTAGNYVREEDTTAQGPSTAGHYIREEGATAQRPSTAGHRIREEDATTQGFLTTGHRVQEEDALAQGFWTAGQGERLPFARHLSGIFPRMMLSSIKKKEGRAEVKVTQLAGSEQSRLKLYIDPRRVSHLAKEIFDVDAEIEDMWIHLKLPNGTNVKGSKIDGARHETLENCFGGKVAAAIRSTSNFSTEVEQGEISTRCVSMQIERDPEFSCLLSLVLDPEPLLTIMADIWPPVHK